MTEQTTPVVIPDEAQPPAERRADRRPRRADRRPRRGGVAAAVGVLGELLITLGVLLGLFVVWQLWWTDVVANRHQEELIADLGWAEITPTPVPTQEPTAEPVDPRRYDAPPVIAEPAVRTTFATLRVPRWGPDYLQAISQGTSRSQVLDELGIGHYEGTAMPGGIGNFAVAAHRVTYGKPFNRIEELQVGDALVVQTEETWYVYRVASTEIVSPRQVEVVAPVPGQPGVAPTAAMMTMTTCHPMYSARERYIVHATFDYWMPTDAGLPPDLDAANGGA
ncbi:class E sortase [Actinotalea fermentans]|uniref:Class E sortase n=1 Tax=Actinotalea fermentans TaxID=43671 RepID=A0A511Z224_9CELL|nr:class E sortase [Actinotalea fermentans]KGM16114.1 sortase [Actinotalea fermentans ATCC 43279 = JCM 9966 = DSM 3133]GEN81505.1 class E sortase [Actinotalea fermentans]